MENKTLASLKVPENLKLDEPLKLVRTEEELYGVNELCRATYKTLYPDISEFHNNPFDKQAHILFTKDPSGKYTSMARLVIDSSLGLPEDPYFPIDIQKYREQGIKLMEFGRFIILDGNPELLKEFYKAVYLIAKAEGVGAIIMAMRAHHVGFHHHKIGAFLLSPDMNLTYGGKHSLACVSWELSATKDRFFDWVGLPRPQNGGES